jgi:uncharacterized protein (TIGR00369 family)
MSEDHFRRLETMYLGAPANEIYQPKIKIRKGAAEVRIEIRPHHHHAARSAHGSVYFKAMDDAAFFAVNSLVEDVFVVTVSFNIHLTRPISEGEMVASGRVINAGRTTWVAEATLEDDRGRVLGHGTGTFMRSTFNLVEAEGYEQGV